MIGLSVEALLIMRRIVSSSKIVGTCDWESIPAHISAHADASYDEGDSRLVVTLTALAEPADVFHHENWTQPPWLPAPQRVEEHVPFTDALMESRNIFQSWARRVQEKIPANISSS